MTINIMGLDVNYIHKGTGNNVILIHGWGNNLNYFNNLINDLQNNYSVYAIDLPGFGKTNIKEDFNTSDYSNIILQFIKQLKISKPTLIGHSFGGKVIIDLITNQNYNPNKIILIDSSGIKKKKSFYKKYKIYKFKLYKKIIKTIYNEQRANYLIEDLRKKCGSKDYNNCNSILRNTLVRIVNEDYKDQLYKIKCPTLIIWGEYDQETPLKDGKIMHKEIRNSGLVIIQNANHFPLDTNYYKCFLIINSFLNDKK